MRRKAKLTIIMMIAIFIVFFCKIITVQESNDHFVNEKMIGEQGRIRRDDSKKEWGNSNQSIHNYTETLMPFHSEDYGDMGIWSTMLTQDGRLFSFSKNDKMKKIH